MSSPKGKLLDFPSPEELSVRTIDGMRMTPTVDAKIKKGSPGPIKGTSLP